MAWRLRLRWDQVRPNSGGWFHVPYQWMCGCSTSRPSRSGVWPSLEDIPLAGRQMVLSLAYALGRSSEEQWLVQGLVPLLGSFLLGMNPLQPAFLDTVLAPGSARHGGASAGPAKAQLLCLPVAFPCLNPLLLPAVRELAPGLVVSSPALGPFLWGDADPLLGRLRGLWLGLPGPFGLCLLWRRGDVYGVLENMAFTEVRPRVRGVSPGCCLIRRDKVGLSPHLRGL